MGFLSNLKAKLSDRLLGSDLAIQRPDIANSPRLTLDFTLAKLSLRHAPHTAMFPIHDDPRDMDIRDTKNFKQNKDGSFAKRVYVRGWTLRGKSNKSLGGVKASAIILYKPNLRINDANFDLFKNSYLTHVILKYCHDFYGSENEGATLGNLGDGFYIYPVKASEIKHKKINGIRWSVFGGGRKGCPSEVIFATPLSSQHLLQIILEPEAYNGVDYYSPETNLRETCNLITKEFIENVHVELSPQSLAEKHQAESHSTAAQVS